jgi:hypothetical protein
MKIKLSELKKFIRESVREMFQEDDIDWKLVEPMNIKEFWDDTTNGEKQLIHALFSDYNKDVLSYLTTEWDLLSKPVNELTDEEFELIHQVKNDPRVTMISSSEDQTLLNLLRNPESLEELKKLATDWRKGRSVDRALRAARTQTDTSVNENRKYKR